MPIKTSGVYEILNTRSKKRYIGSSFDIHGRLGAHRRALRRGNHANRHLQRAWQKDGEQSFLFEGIEDCAKVDVRKREQHHIDRFPSDVLYNIALDAHRGAGRWGRLGKKNSPEHNAAISAANKGGVNTWAKKAAASRVNNYTRLVVGTHLDGQVRRFRYALEAAHELGLSRTSVKNILCGYSKRTRNGWTFHYEAKQEG